MLIAAVHGPIYRAFTDLCHARDFVLGRFRLGSLVGYRTIEDTARVDATEGAGHYIDSTDVHEHFEFGNPIYMLCCSSSTVDLTFLRRKLGPHIVRIDDPAKLACDLGSYLDTQNILVFGRPAWRKVEYTKGTCVAANLDETMRAELSISQKAPLFFEEKEIRLSAIMKAKCSRMLLAQHLYVSLGASLPYARVLSE